MSINSLYKAAVISILLYSLLLFYSCSGDNSGTADISQGILIDSGAMKTAKNELLSIIPAHESLPPKGPGLALAMGGAHLRILKEKYSEVIITMPQITNGQVPVAYAVSCSPEGSCLEYRIIKRDKLNTAVRITVNGKKDAEIQIEWIAVVLLKNKPEMQSEIRCPESLIKPTSCVQAEHKNIKALSRELWPEDGEINSYAENIQSFIMGMVQKNQPAKIDAISILDSGCNWICTANANLACALMRTKGICARSLAVIPVISRRLEMHRVVEYCIDGQWISFDPSSLNKNIPLMPWQGIVMAQTTIDDEETSMKPRMGSMPGCPYGQEIEICSNAVSLWGNDFFWTIAIPLAEFEVDEENARLIETEWIRFLETGLIQRKQINAARAENLNDLIKHFKQD